tara:strand:- start:2160 stop:2903 length:744 start_codon:yes stop_codon:yes gene_type:complete
MRGEVTSVLLGAASDDLALGAESCEGRYVIPRLERTVTLLMLGRLKHRGSDTICRIRNVSSGGMRVDTGTPLEKGETVAIEARSGVCVEGRVAWTNHLAAGIAFSQNVDHPELLAAPTGPSGARLATRSPRFQATARARLDVGGRVVKLRLVNISLGGCRVECDANLPSEVEGRLAIQGLPPTVCAGRWVTGKGAGLIFPTKLGFAEFACWLEKPELRFGSDSAQGGTAQAGAFRAPGSVPFIRRNS